MPELADLEVVRDVLNRRRLGQVIVSAEVIPPGGPIVVRDLPAWTARERERSPAGQVLGLYFEHSGRTVANSHYVDCEETGAVVPDAAGARPSG
jgi:hypothetical protein